MMREFPPLQQSFAACVTRQRGFSRFEFAVAAAVFAIAVGIATNRVNSYQRHIESVAAEQLISTLRVALQLRVAHLTAAQRRQEISALAKENPIGWLSEKPKNYLGEYFNPDNKNLPDGHWYFNARQNTLVYLLTERKSFAFGASILLKFKVISARVPASNAPMGPAAGEESLSLVAVSDQ
jgi:general secretion pathway protein G